MNWLAHLYLSDKHVESRMGNILADVIKGKDRKQLSPTIRQGIRCHQAVDAFTDYHPVFGRCQQYIRSELRRYSGIVVDVFYDHFLACHWTTFSDVELKVFTSEIYRSFLASPVPLPIKAKLLFQRMSEEDWLAGSADLAEIKDTLLRITRRLKRPVELIQTLDDLERNYADFERDFLEFFPDLCKHVRNWKLREQTNRKNMD